MNVDNGLQSPLLAKQVHTSESKTRPLEIAGKIAVISTIALAAIGCAALSWAGAVGLLAISLPVAVWAAIGSSTFSIGIAVDIIAGYLFFGKQHPNIVVPEELNEEIADREDEAENLRASLQELEAAELAITVKDARIAELQTEVDSARENVARLQRQVASTSKMGSETDDARVADLQRQLEEERARAASLQKNVRRLERDLAALQTNEEGVEPLQDNLNEERAKVQVYKASLELSNLEKRKIAGLLERAQSELSDQAEVVESLQAQVRILLSEQEQRRSDQNLLIAAQQKQAETERENAVLKREFQEERATLERELARVQTELVELRAKVLQNAEAGAADEKILQFTQHYEGRFQILLKETCRLQTENGTFDLHYIKRNAEGIPLPVENLAMVRWSEILGRLSALDPSSESFDRDLNALRVVTEKALGNFPEQIIWKVLQEELQQALQVIDSIEIRESKSLLSSYLDRCKKSISEQSKDIDQDFKAACEKTKKSQNQAEHVTSMMTYLDQYEKLVQQHAKQQFNIDVPASHLRDMAQIRLYRILLAHGNGETPTSVIDYLNLSSRDFDDQRDQWPPMEPIDSEALDTIKLLKHAITQDRDAVSQLDDHELTSILENVFKDRLLASQVKHWCQGRGGSFSQALKKATTLNELKLIFAKSVNASQIAELGEWVREKHMWSESTLKELLQDSSFLSSAHQSNLEVISDELLNQLMQTIERIEQAEKLVQQLCYVNPLESVQTQYDELKGRLPSTIRLANEHRIRAAQNALLLEEKLFPLRAGRTNLTQMVVRRSPLWNNLAKLVQLPNSLTTDSKDILSSLNRWHDLRWIARLDETQMRELISDTIDSHLLVNSEVYEILRGLRDNQVKFEELYRHLPSKQFGQIAAAMLIEVGEGTTHPTAAKVELHRILSNMLKRNKDIARNLVLGRHYAWIIPEGKYLTDLPPFTGLTNKKTSAEKGSRAWKLIRGGSSNPAVAMGEESLLGIRSTAKDAGWSYDPGYSTPVHEIMHHVYKYGMQSGISISGKNLRDLKTEIKDLFTEKNRKIKAQESLHSVYTGWRYSTGETHACSYAATDEHEWGAEFATAFFEANGVIEIGRNGKPVRQTANGQILTREQLKSLGEEERRMCAVYEDVFGRDTYIPYCNPRLNRVAG